jgi:hypothetical protein
MNEPGCLSASTNRSFKMIQNIFTDLCHHKRGALSLVSITEELLDRKVAAPV